MKIVIDRFEGDFVVCETKRGKMMNILKLKLPPQAKEGDVLIVIGDFMTIDIEETEKRRRGARKLMDEVWDD